MAKCQNCPGLPYCIVAAMIGLNPIEVFLLAKIGAIEIDGVPIHTDEAESAIHRSFPDKNVNREA